MSRWPRRAPITNVVAMLVMVVLVMVVLVMVVLVVVTQLVGAAIPAGQTALTPRAAGAAVVGGAQFTPVGPVRIADTRRADIGPLGVVPAGGTIDVSLVGRAGLPTGSLVAVAVTITAVDSERAGYVTAWPTGASRPEVSNVNVARQGDTVPNFAIVTLAADGRFSLFSSVPTHLLVDLAGVFVATEGSTAEGRTVAVTPARALDTRSGARPGAGGEVAVSLAGRHGIPGSAAAVAVTVTAVDARAAGFVTVWPDGAPRPEVSSLNVPGAGRTVANLALVPLGANGSVRLFTESGSHLLLDVVGYVTGPGAEVASAGLFVAAGPERQLDSRQPGGRGPLLGGYRADLELALPPGVSAGSVAMVAANLTVTDTADRLFLTAYPYRTSRPETSNLNADEVGQTIAAFSLVPIGINASISARPSARTHLLVDVAGFFLGTPAAVDLGVAPNAPTPQGSPPVGGFDAAIAGFLLGEQAPGASVVVAKDGRIVYARAYGLADPATGEAMRIEHHFRIASLSKVMTAITVQRLVGVGQLGLDRKVWPLLDSVVPLPSGADPRYRSITVRQLLGHVSGIPAAPDPYFDDDPDVLAAFGAAGPSSCEAAARWTVGRPLTRDPGTYYSYANVNFCLLGLVIQQVTGRGWAEVVREQAQLPVDATGMYLGRTYERRPLDVVHSTPALTAKGGGWFMESLGAAGAWMGTPIDLVRVLDGMDPAKPGPDLLTAGQLAEMRARPSTDRGDDQVWYGLGVLSYRQGAAFGHTGALEGARSMAVHEANGITWAITVNAKFSDHQDKLLALMDGALATTPLSSWPAYDLARDLP